MKYVFDTSAFVTIFRNYYESRFPSLWERFYELIDDGKIVSTMEVKREIGVRNDALNGWAKNNKQVFPVPTRAVAHFVSKLFEVHNFKHSNVDRKKMYKGGYVADPFVVATAASRRGSVVTLESYRKEL